jgi:hypothetical protein
LLRRPSGRFAKFESYHNVEIVRASKELAEGAAMLTKRCLDLAGHLITRDKAPASIERGGRKAHAIST